MAMPKMVGGSFGMGMVIRLIISIVLTLLWIFIIVCGVYIVKNQNNYPETIDANIKSAVCDEATNKCTLTLQYTVNNQVYDITNYKTTGVFVDGGSLTINYNSSDPSIFVIKPIPNWFGWVIITIFSIFLILTWVAFYFSYTKSDIATYTDQTQSDSNNTPAI